MTSHRNMPDSIAAPERNRSLLVNGSLLIAVFALFALLVNSPITSPKIQSIDDSVRGWLGAAPGDASYQWFLPVTLQHIGDTLGSTLLCAVIVAHV